MRRRDKKEKAKCLMLGMVTLAIVLLMVPALQAEGDTTISVVEIDHNFFSGEELERTLLIRNNTLKSEEVVVRWQTLVLPAIIEKGEEQVELKPLTSQEIKVSLKMPELKRRAKLVWKMKVLSDGKLKAERQFYYSIFPQDISLRIKRLLTQKKVGIFDLDGRLKRRFEDLEIPFAQLSSQLSLESFKGDIVITGPEVNSTELSSAIFALQKRVDEGLSIIFFPLKIDVDNLPIPLANLSRQPLEIRELTILSPGHPVFVGLNEDDLGNWRGDGIISYFPLMKPVKGNFRILAEESPSTTLLMEFPWGRGRFIFCQMLIADKFDSEPVAQVLFENLLRYALTEQKPLHRVFIYGDPEAKLMKLLNSLNVIKDAREKSTLIIICADQESRGFITEHQPGMFSYLKKLSQTGGRALLFSSFAEAIDFLGIKEKMKNMEIVPSEPQGRGYRDEGIIILDRESPLLWGMSEDEINLLTRWGRMIKFHLDKAEIIICQAKFEEEDIVSLRTLSQLLTNFGVKIAGEGGDD